MKKLLILLLTLLSYYITLAQAPSNQYSGNAPSGGQNNRPAKKFAPKAKGIGHIYGKLIDAKSKEPMPYTPVAISKHDSIVGGCLTGSNGEFSIENLPFGKLTLKISGLGYKAIVQPVLVTPQNFEQDLGNIKLEAESSVLKGVEIVAEKSASEISIDRRVFNVDKNITSKGGTATDVMNNVPSVTIDANGNALLRQQTATIYVDGRPTTLTLDQIPADQIDRVEVITNPSAKYEASTTGGIINIVMKENTKPGYNGIVTGGLGTNNHRNGMVALNVKKKPFGFAITYNINEYKNPVTGYTNRTNLFDGSPTGYFNNTDNTTFQRTFQAGTATFDYYLNNRNTLSLSENMVIGNFNNYDVQTFSNRAIRSGIDSILSNGTRIDPTLTHFENYTTKLHYRKTFPKKGEEFTADANMNYKSTAHNNGYYYTTMYNDETTPSTALPSTLQNYSGYSNSLIYTLQADYTNPINDSTKLELGVRSNYKPSTQSLTVTDSVGPKNYVTDQLLTSAYKIQDLVNAAYINYTSKYIGINYAAGLRFEDSYYKGILTNKNDSSFTYNYPSSVNNIFKSLFPSLYLTKKFNDNQEMQFNISRKINRPNFRQLMPFIQASDPQDYTIGNPNLTPEFITMAEINFNQLFRNGNFFFGFFYRNSQNPLTSYTYAERPGSDTLITTTINGTHSNTFGMDNTFKYTFAKVFETTLNMNLFYTFINADYQGSSISNQGFNYTAKVNFVYHFPKNFNLQLSGNYESPKVIPQGTSMEVYFADAGISKEIKKFITLTASVSDIFDTKGRGTILTTDDYTQTTWGRRESRYFKITASVRFGNSSLPTFRRKPTEKKPDDNSDTDF